MKPAIEYVSKSPQETEEFAARLAASLRGGCVIGLIGSLGSGKTCFVRGMAAGLGVKTNEVSSPTFVLCHEYAASDSHRLIHVDAYRVTEPADLESFGFSELLESDDAIVAVEWADRAADALPDSRIEITLTHVGNESRLIRVSASDEFADRLRETLGKVSSAPCRTCGKAISSISETFPFCSDRCRLADLGKWFKGTYTISRHVEPDD